MAPGDRVQGGGRVTAGLPRRWWRKQTVRPTSMSGAHAPRPRLWTGQRPAIRRYLPPSALGATMRGSRPCRAACFVPQLVPAAADGFARAAGTDLDGIGGGHLRGRDELARPNVIAGAAAGGAVGVGAGLGRWDDAAGLDAVGLGPLVGILLLVLEARQARRRAVGGLVLRFSCRPCPPFRPLLLGREVGGLRVCSPPARSCRTRALPMPRGAIAFWRSIVSRWSRPSRISDTSRWISETVRRTLPTSDKTRGSQAACLLRLSLGLLLVRLRQIGPRQQRCEVGSGSAAEATTQTYI